METPLPGDVIVIVSTVRDRFDGLGLVSAGLIPTTCGLIVYGNGSGDRWVMHITALVKENDIDLSLPIGLSVQDIINRS